MAAKSLRELFVEELRDMYDAEKRLTRALPKLAKAATSPELKSAFTSHLAETEKQVTRLEQVFQSIDEKARGKKCDGIMGIIEEGESAIEELDGSVLDAALIAGGQKAEHYEIASYGTLAYFADVLGLARAKDLLGTTLDEEKAADEKLNQIAKSKVNRDALAAGSSGEGDDEEGGFAIQRSIRGAAERMGLVQDRPSPRRRSTSTRGRSRQKRGRR